MSSPIAPDDHQRLLAALKRLAEWRERHAQSQKKNPAGADWFEPLTGSADDFEPDWNGTLSR